MGFTGGAQQRIDCLGFYGPGLDALTWQPSVPTMSIKSLPAAARPREKLLAHGPQALADVELLAVLLRTGLPGQGVLALADAVLGEFKGWAGLVHATRRR